MALSVQAGVGAGSREAYPTADTARAYPLVGAYATAGTAAAATDTAGTGTGTAFTVHTVTTNHTTVVTGCTGVAKLPSPSGERDYLEQYNI